MSPRAEAPGQRTLFTAQAPEMEEEEESDGNGRSLFNRLANVGKSIGNVGRAATPHLKAAMQENTVTTERKAEVRETQPHARDEEEFYDIPAFLRRQAN